MTRKEYNLLKQQIENSLTVIEATTVDKSKCLIGKILSLTRHFRKLQTIPQEAPWKTD
jgi:hypothetical protein